MFKFIRWFVFHDILANFRGFYTIDKTSIIAAISLLLQYKSVFIVDFWIIIDHFRHWFRKNDALWNDSFRSYIFRLSFIVKLRCNLAKTAATFQVIYLLS